MWIGTPPLMRVISSMLLVLATLANASAGPRRPSHRTFCVPVYIEGAGTVRICPPARGR